MTENLLFASKEASSRKPMRIYLFRCLYCEKQFKGKRGFDRCCAHMDKKHMQEIDANRMEYPINFSKEFVNGKWRTFIP